MQNRSKTEILKNKKKFKKSKYVDKIEQEENSEVKIEETNLRRNNEKIKMYKGQLEKLQKIPK